MSELKKQDKSLTEQKKKSDKSLIYSIMVPIVGVLFKTILPVKYHGLEHITSLDAPYIMMGNHTTMLDPFMMALAVPKQQIRFIGKKELWKFPPFAWFANSITPSLWIVTIPTWRPCAPACASPVKDTCWAYSRRVPVTMRA